MAKCASVLTTENSTCRRVRDAYALPRMDDTFTALSGSKWFSNLDLKSGYYQIEVDEVDKPKTAFVCPLGF